MKEHDYSIHVELKIANGRRTLCRALDMNHQSYEHEIKKNQKYLIIYGWGAGGQCQLPFCIKHSKKFFEQIKMLQEQIKE